MIESYEEYKKEVVPVIKKNIRKELKSFVAMNLFRGPIIFTVRIPMESI